MAVQNSHVVPTVANVIHKTVPIKRPSSIVVMCTGSNISINRAPFQIRLPLTRNKVVFEDQTKGIVCYSDENGEVTCEGFDEGPRFQPLSNSSFVSNPSSRDADIIDLLQNCWLQVQGGPDAKFY